MSDAALDRLLEFALREVLREPNVALPSSERRVSAGDVLRRRLLVVAIAAAAVTVVVAILAWPVQRDAIADRELWLADASGVFRPAAVVPFGAVGWNRDAPIVELTSPGGAAIRMLQHSAIRLGEAVELLGGEIELPPATRPRVVRTRDAAFELPPDSHVFVRSAPFAVLESKETTPMNLPDLLARSSQAPLALSITVLLGCADLVDAQERSRVGAGETRIVQDRDAARRDAARATALFVATNRDLPEPSDENSMLQWKELDEQHSELGLCLLRSPAAVAAVRKDLLAALSSENVPEERCGRLLQLAQLTDDQALHEAVAKLVEKRRSALGFEHWIALASRGNTVARTELHRFLQEPNGALGVRAVAALVLGGDPSRRAELEPFVDIPMGEAIEDFQKFDARCLAAVAMAHLGDSEARTRVVKDLTTTVAERLDSPQAVAGSADFVRRAAYFLGQPSPRLDNLDLRLRAFAVPALGSGGDADAVRKAVADLGFRVAAVGSASRR